MNLWQFSASAKHRSVASKQGGISPLTLTVYQQSPFILHISIKHSGAIMAWLISGLILVCPCAPGLSVSSTLKMCPTEAHFWYASKVLVKKGQNKKQAPKSEESSCKVVESYWQRCKMTCSVNPAFTWPPEIRLISMCGAPLSWRKRNKGDLGCSPPWPSPLSQRCLLRLPGNWFWKDQATKSDS